MRLTLIIILGFFFGVSILVRAEDAPKTPSPEETEALFKSLYGEKLDEVQKSPSKKDDLDFGKKLLDDARALASNPALQRFVQFQAANLLAEDKDGYADAVKLFQSLRETLPPAQRPDLTLKMCDLQEKIVKALSPTKDKDRIGPETERLTQLEEESASIYLARDNYKEAIAALKTVEALLKKSDPDAAKEVGDRIKKIETQYRRFKKIETALEKLSKDPADAKANQEVGLYYFLEKGNLFKAWPFLDRSGDGDLQKFLALIETAIAEGEPVAGDGLSLARFPVLVEHPAYYLEWLKEKEFSNRADLIIAQMDRIKAEKPVETEKVRAAIEGKLKEDTTPGALPASDYLELGRRFLDFAGKLDKIEGLDERVLKKGKGDLLFNQVLALSKAQLKLEKDPEAKPEQKLRLEIDLNTAKANLEKTGEKVEPVTLKTPFRLSGEAIALSGDGLTYTFDDASWEQFKRDWDSPQWCFWGETKPGTERFQAENGRLKVFTPASTWYQVTAKKKKWSASLEISFDLFKLKEYPKGSATFHWIWMDKTSEKNWRSYQSVVCHCFWTEFWLGVFGADEYLNSEKAQKITVHKDVFRDKTVSRIRLIKEETKFRFFLDDEEAFSADTKERKDLEIPSPNGKEIRLKVLGSSETEIDNLYIGPPRPIKKKPQPAPDKK